ncbi:MAG: hypothetical protein N3A63_03610 [Bacteroidetes bacterium]|nr:hypothetical protein [Bacteroidota bacterium]
MRDNTLVQKIKLSLSDSLIFSALGVALGITFPQLFHNIGLGAAFLPLFLPIVLLSFLVPYFYLITLAMVLPLLNSIVFGMPPFPISLFLVAELLLTASLLYFLQKRLPTPVSIVLSLLIERTALYLFFSYVFCPQWTTPYAPLMSYPGVILNSALGILFWKVFSKDQ